MGSFIQKVCSVNMFTAQVKKTVNSINYGTNVFVYQILNYME